MSQKRVLLKRVRKSAGLTQEELAYRLGVDRSTVVRWEAGINEPSAWMRPRLGKILGVTRDELGSLLAGEMESRPQTQLRDELHDGEQPQLAAASHDICHSLDHSVVAVLGPSQTLAVLDEFTQSMIARYELEGPHRLAPEAQALRRLCRELGGQVSGADERLRLAQVSARQSALLAYMSVNLSRYADAEHYALDAAMLATAAKDWSLLAWIKGTLSFTAYYQERYSDALNLARVGVQLAGSDSQRIRLLSNGMARAAGKLGDRTTVDHAVSEAFELVEEQHGPIGLTPCIDFVPYGWARTAANAATAYLSVGDYPQALHLTHELSTVVATSGSDWSRSLVHLDEASALTLGRQADLEYAAAVGMAALAASANKPIASIGNRASELAASLQCRGPHRAGQDFADTLREWKLASTRMSV